MRDSARLESTVPFAFLSVNLGMPVRVSKVHTSEIRHLIDREPFRPFAVRLSSGAEYLFSEPRQFGAPEDLHMIFFFGKDVAVRIDTENIVEIVEK
jgi:hypothetical protein